MPPWPHGGFLHTQKEYVATYNPSTPANSTESLKLANGNRHRPGVRASSAHLNPAPTPRLNWPTAALNPMPIRVCAKNVDRCGDFDNVGTQDFLTGKLEQREKQAWMLRNSLE